MKKIGQNDPGKEKKVVLADGNYVYNGGFQEGENRLGYWNIWKLGDSRIRVTNDNNVRRLEITAGKWTSALNRLWCIRKIWR